MPECYWPLWDGDKKVGIITQEYGVKSNNYLHINPLMTRHNGKDIAGVVMGHPIKGMSGTVEEVGNDKDGYGLYVKIRDDVQKCWWIYAHLSKIDVVSMQRIYTGQIIGGVGNTGYTLGATGIHLHLECKPFDFASHYINGALGRIDYTWFLTISSEEEDEMTDQQVRELKRGLARIAMQQRWGSKTICLYKKKDNQTVYYDNICTRPYKGSWDDLLDEGYLPVDIYTV